MRKHDVRKWLHAVLDLLPVILIPVFMIYSHRHDVAQDFQITTQEPVYYETNDVNSVEDLIVGHAYSLVIEDNEDISNPFKFNISEYKIVSYNRVDSTTTTGNRTLIELEKYQYRVYLRLLSEDNSYQTLIYYPYLKIDFVFYSYTSLPITFANIHSCDDYIKEYQEVVTTIPKDVMTSFMDRFNNTIDNYFNMGNVFNLNGVYQWFNTNIFSGNAPTVIYSIWNIALYELVMDLLFLLYGLFMWFIDMVEHLMEKPFKSIK